MLFYPIVQDFTLQRLHTNDSVKQSTLGGQETRDGYVRAHTTFGRRPYYPLHPATPQY